MEELCNILTIAIPTYKRPQYLRQAIDSAVNQQNVSISYNIIVVNNDPDTDMSEMEKSYEDSDVDVCFYTNEKNLGMLGNVNRCVELASGKWIAFLHDDDLLLPNYVHEISKFLGDEDTACFIPRRYLLFDEAVRESLEKKQKIKHAILGLFPGRYMNKRETYPVYVDDNVFAWQNCYGAPSCGALFNKEKIQSCGLFFPEGTYSWDFFSFLKLNYQFDVKILNPILSVYRMSTGASLRPEVQLDFFKSFEALKEQMTNVNAECARFIRKYNREISFLNTGVLGEKAKMLAKEKKLELVEKRPSTARYVRLMYRRLKYFSVRHLDVEVPLTKKGKKSLCRWGY